MAAFGRCQGRKRTNALRGIPNGHCLMRTNRRFHIAAQIIIRLLLSNTSADTRHPFLEWMSMPKDRPPVNRTPQVAFAMIAAAIVTLALRAENGVRANKQRAGIADFPSRAQGLLCIGLPCIDRMRIF